MIDTIKLRLPLKEGPYLNDDEFMSIPLSHIRQFSKHPYNSTLLNPGSMIYRKTKYTPTYIGEKVLSNNGSGVAYFLSIEVSLPKLMFGNNINELSPGEKSLNEIVTRIQKAIKEDLGLDYSLDEILSGCVTKIHIGKNFIFNDPGAPTIVVNIVGKSRADRIQDDYGTRYGCGSYSFKTHTNGKEVILYDKKSDILQANKSPKRAIDNTINEINEESSVYDLVNDRCSGILRLEVRLNNMKLIRNTFPELKENLTLENVYLNANIMQCLRDEWTKITSNISMIELGRSNAITAFETAAANRFNEDLKVKDCLVIAAITAIVNATSLDYLRSIVEKYFGRNGWNNVKKRVINTESKRSRYFKEIDTELQDYNPIWV